MVSDPLTASHRSEGSVITRAPGLSALALAALLPGLIAYNVPPSPTLFNQAAALGLWGAAAGLLAATMGLLLVGAALRPAPALLGAFFAAWVAAGVASSGIAIVQVFAPQWADGEWIARSGLAGRAVGNLRQPNHLASLLLWSAVAVVPLVELGALARTRLRGPCHKLVCQAARSRLDLV